MKPTRIESARVILPIDDATTAFMAERDAFAATETMRPNYFMRPYFHLATSSATNSVVWGVSEGYESNKIKLKISWYSKDVARNLRDAVVQDDAQFLKDSKAQVGGLVVRDSQLTFLSIYVFVKDTPVGQLVIPGAIEQSGGEVLVDLKLSEEGFRQFLAASPEEIGFQPRYGRVGQTTSGAWQSVKGSQSTAIEVKSALMNKSLVNEEQWAGKAPIFQFDRFKIVQELHQVLVKTISLWGAEGLALLDRSENASINDFLSSTTLTGEKAREITRNPTYEAACATWLEGLVQKDESLREKIKWMKNEKGEMTLFIDGSVIQEGKLTDSHSGLLSEILIGGEGSKLSKSKSNEKQTQKQSSDLTVNYLGTTFRRRGESNFYDLHEVKVSQVLQADGKSKIESSGLTIFSIADDNGLYLGNYFNAALTDKKILEAVKLYEGTKKGAAPDTTAEIRASLEQAYRARGKAWSAYNSLVGRIAALKNQKLLAQDGRQLDPISILGNWTSSENIKVLPDKMGAIEFGLKVKVGTEQKEFIVKLPFETDDSVAPDAKEILNALLATKPKEEPLPKDLAAALSSATDVAAVEALLEESVGVAVSPENQARYLQQVNKRIAAEVANVSQVTGQLIELISAVSVVADAHQAFQAQVAMIEGTNAAGRQGANSSSRDEAAVAAAFSQLEAALAADSSSAYRWVVDSIYARVLQVGAGDRGGVTGIGSWDTFHPYMTSNMPGLPWSYGPALQKLNAAVRNLGGYYSATDVAEYKKTGIVKVKR
jgi:hypothetical protein